MKKKKKGTVQRGECRKNEEWKRHGWFAAYPHGAWLYSGPFDEGQKS